MNANVRTALFIAVFLGAGFLIWKLLGGTGPVAVYETPTELGSRPAAPAGESIPVTSGDSASASQTPPQINPVARPELVGRQGAAEKKSTAATSGPGKIQGLVRTKDGRRPIAGARVVITLQPEKGLVQNPTVRSFDAPDPNAPQWETKTNGQGMYKVERLPIGAYGLVATNQDASGVSATRLTEYDPIQDVNFDLEPTDSISGVVRDESGAVVAGALVAPQESDEPRKARVNSEAARTFAGQDGAFEVRYLPKARWKLAVRAKGYAVTLTDLIATGAKNVNVTLKKGGSASGRVIESTTRQPVPDIQVVASGTVSIDRQVASTNTKGEFEFTALADGPCALSIEDAKRVMIGEAPKCVIQAGNTVSGLEITVATGAVITGRTFNVDNGEPIEGVTIAAGARGTASARSATSGADGVYRLEGLNAGQFTLQRRWKPGLLHGEQREQKSVSVSLGEELTGIDFPIKYGLNLRGRVTDTSGKPLDRVNVSSEEVSQNGEGEDTFTTEDGKFEHRGFSAHAKITIRAQKGDQVAGPIGPLTFGEEDMNDVEIVMEKAASISGVVVDKSGRPQENIYISAWAPNPDSGRGNGNGASSDSKGNFKIEGLTAGTYNISMQRNDNYRSSQRQADPIPVGKGEDVTGVRLVFDDDSGLTISGRVTNKETKPIKNASVNAYSSQGGSQGWTQTDAEGRYTISGLKEGAHQVNVYHQDYSQANLPEVMAGSANVDFVLEGHGIIEGQVLDAATGKPLTTFQVLQVQGTNVQLGPWMQNQFTTFASPDGKFRLERVQVGDNTVFAQAKGYAPASTPVPGVEAGKTVSGIVIRLESGASVTGVVKDTAGKLVSGAQVFVGQAPQPFQSYGGNGAQATTNQNGEFTLDSLPAQETTIYVSHSDYTTGNVTVTPTAGRATSVEVILGQGGTITGTVRVGGKPAANVQVGAYSQTNPGSYVNAQTDASGAYTLAKIPDGTVSVNANLSVGAQGGSNRRSQSQQAEVVAGQTTVVNFEFGGGTAALEGVITSSGQPVNNAQVNVILTDSQNQHESFNAQTGADGRYHMDSLPAGSATVMVFAASAQGEAPQQRTATIQLVNGQVTQRDFDLNSGSVLSGTVTGAQQGEMVSILALRGDVAITEFSETFFRSIMDKFAGQGVAQNGVYKISGLEPGRYTIIAIAINPANARDTSKLRHTTASVDLAGAAGTLDLAIP